MTKVCATCKFWDQPDDEAKKQGVGVCRRYPPAVMAMPRLAVVQGMPPEFMPTTSFPATKSTAWCGEWEQNTAPVVV